MANGPCLKICVNGEEQSVNNGATLASLLADLQIDRRYCAVERNLKVVPREKHAECLLAAGDRIEIVTLVGGG